jgi:hypothetical protein
VPIAHVLHRIGVALAGLTLIGTAAADVPTLPPAVEQTARTQITRAALEAPIRFLASDLLAGRGPGTRADQVARLYLELVFVGYAIQAPEYQWDDFKSAKLAGKIRAGN